MKIINNPIITGFNPDPSIVRVGDEYYIANSTFEYFPGVKIYKSNDLVNWELYAQPLSDTKKIDLDSVLSSAGVWAPVLRYHNGFFYLVYSNVRTWRGIGKKEAPFHDVENYIIYAKDVRGPWSDPIYLNGNGIDPSIMFDDDKVWLLTAKSDFRSATGDFAGGILLQQLDSKTFKPIGQPVNIFEGSDLGCTEGPHLYKRNGYYYLLVAEGGTAYGHCVTMLRSKNIYGPYELHPDNPILTSSKDDELKKAGHASICEYDEDKWLMVHLCGRPIINEGKNSCILGRETAMQKVIWKNDWLYLDSETKNVKSTISFDEEDVDKLSNDYINEFDNEKLDNQLQTLRVPIDEEYSLTERKGCLRLYGTSSIISESKQSLLAKRIQNFKICFETCVEFYPEQDGQEAGLVIRYSEDNQYFLRLTKSLDNEGLDISVVQVDNANLSIPFHLELKENHNKIYLKVEIIKEKIKLYYSYNNIEWEQIPKEFDSTILSDEYQFVLGFTGTFVGLFVSDLMGHRKYADFHYIKYTEMKD